MKISIRKLEFTWHIFALLVLFGAILVLWRSETIQVQTAYEGDPILRNILVFTYLVSFVFLFLKIPKYKFLEIFRNKLLWILIGYVFLSSFWSSVPLLTLRKATAFLFPTIYGILLAIRYSLSKFTKIILMVIGISLVTSLIFVSFFPSWGLQVYDGELLWRGIFKHKNALGQLAVLAFVASLIFFHSSPLKVRILSVLSMFLSLLIIFYSESTTSIVSVLFMFFFINVMLHARKMRKDMVAFLSIVIFIIAVVLLLLVDNYEYFFSLVGKESTLTGRASLWEQAFTLGLKRPVTGFGYSSFWLGWDGPSAYLWKIFSWHPNHGHNGYLDIWLELGLFGLFLLLVVMTKLLLNLFYRYITANNYADQKYYLFHLSFCVYMLLLNVSESVFLQSEMGGAFIWSWNVFLLVATSSRPSKRKITEV